jgi:cellulose synthase/poly-beta-1,6-N-acetylglucosamine synthase-like glycosyltransferase
MIDNHNTVLFIIPNMDGGITDLEKTIVSILGQELNGNAVQIFVMDNCSKEDRYMEILGFQKKYKGVLSVYRMPEKTKKIYLIQKIFNLFPYMEHSFRSYKYISILDVGDILEKDYISHHIELLRNYRGQSNIVLSIKHLINLNFALPQINKIMIPDEMIRYFINTTYNVFIENTNNIVSYIGNMGTLDYYLFFYVDKIVLSEKTILSMHNTKNSRFSSLEELVGKFYYTGRFCVLRNIPGKSRLIVYDDIMKITDVYLADGLLKPEQHKLFKEIISIMMHTFQK